MENGVPYLVEWEEGGDAPLAPLQVRSPTESTSAGASTPGAAVAKSSSSASPSSGPRSSLPVDPIFVTPERKTVVRDGDNEVVVTSPQHRASTMNDRDPHGSDGPFLFEPRAQPWFAAACESVSLSRGLRTLSFTTSPDQSPADASLASKT